MSSPVKLIVHRCVRMTIALGLVALALMGCNEIPDPESSLANPVSFEDLCKLEKGQLEGMTPTELEAWVTEKFEFAPIITRREDGEIAYRWGPTDAPNAPFGYAVARDGEIVDISYYNVEKGPNLGDVVAGLGEPATVYRSVSFHDPPLLEFGLDYPKLGVSVYNSELRNRMTLMVKGELSADIEPDMPVNLVVCYRPADTMKEVLERDLGDSPMGLSTQLESRLPWPGFGVRIPLENDS
jgi:hypothetical protein